MTAKVADALIKRFNEPLSDTDIHTIARLTNLDPAALRVAAGMQGPDWTVPYLAYMTRGELLEDEVSIRQIIQRSKSITIVNGKLHHCSVSGAFQ